MDLVRLNHQIYSLYGVQQQLFSYYTTANEAITYIYVCVCVCGLYQGKAINAGGVAVSALEMAQHAQMEGAWVS